MKRTQIQIHKAKQTVVWYACNLINTYIPLSDVLMMKCSSFLMLSVVHDAVGLGGWGRKGKRSLTGGPEFGA